MAKFCASGGQVSVLADNALKNSNSLQAGSTPHHYKTQQLLRRETGRTLLPLRCAPLRTSNGKVQNVGGKRKNAARGAGLSQQGNGDFGRRSLGPPLRHLRR